MKKKPGIYRLLSFQSFPEINHNSDILCLKVIVKNMDLPFSAHFDHKLSIKNDCIISLNLPSSFILSTRFPLNVWLIIINKSKLPGKNLDSEIM